MTNRKISQLAALTTPAAGDYLPIVDISEAAAADQNKRITIEELLRGAPDGTAAAPSIAFESDPNTGIYSAGADRVAISTGGTGRLFVDASGDVGVGTDAPNKNSWSGPAVTLQCSPNGAYEISDGNTLAAAFALQGDDRIEVINFRSGPLTFKTANTERLRITSAGLVGIGTSSPSTTNSGLDIASGGLSLVIGADGSASTRTNVTTKQARIGAYHYTNTEEPIGVATVFSTASSNAIYFGGGTASVNAATSLEFYTAASTTTTTGTSRMRIDSSGRVGIGTTPDARLTIQDGVNIVARVKQLAFNNYSNEGAGITFGRTSDGAELSAVGVADSEQFLIASRRGVLFGVGGGGLYSAVSEAARIDEFGRLLVGTSSARATPASASLFARLQLEGSDNNQSAFSITNTTNGASGRAANIRTARIRGTSIVAADDVLGQWSGWGYDGSDFLEGARINFQVDGTPGTNDMPGRLVFSVTADGASSPTEAMRIKNSRILNFANTPVYADNAAAKTGGLVDGDVYRKSDGTLMIVYT